MNHFRHMHATKRLIRWIVEHIAVTVMLAAPYAYYFYQMAP